MQGMKPKVHPTAEAASKAGVGGSYHPMPKPPSLGASFAGTPAHALEHPAQQAINAMTSPHGPTHAQLSQLMSFLPPPHPQQTFVPERPPVVPVVHAMVPMVPPSVVPVMPVRPPAPVGADVASRLLALRAALGGGH